MFSLPCKSRELPDQDLLKWGVRLRGGVEHLAELGAIGDTARFGFIDVLADHNVAVALGKLPQGAQLGGDREVDILPVAGDPRIECGTDWLRFATHSNVLSTQASGNDSRRPFRSPSCTHPCSKHDNRSKALFVDQSYAPTTSERAMPGWSAHNAPPLELRRIEVGGVVGGYATLSETANGDTLSA